MIVYYVLIMARIHLYVEDIQTRIQLVSLGRQTFYARRGFHFDAVTYFVKVVH